MCVTCVHLICTYTKTKNFTSVMFVGSFLVNQTGTEKKTQTTTAPHNTTWYTHRSSERKKEMLMQIWCERLCLGNNAKTDMKMVWQQQLARTQCLTNIYIVLSWPMLLFRVVTKSMHKSGRVRDWLKRCAYQNRNQKHVLCSICIPNLVLSFCIDLAINDPSNSKSHSINQ